MRRPRFLLVLSLLAPAAFAANNGTSLSLSATAGSPVCSPDSASVNLSVTATSNASASPATFTVSTDGSTFTTAAITDGSGWVTGQKIKSWTTSIPVTVPSSASSNVTVCATQPGNDRKSACTTVLVTPQCAPPAFCPCFTTDDVANHILTIPAASDTLACIGVATAGHCDAETFLATPVEGTVCGFQANPAGSSRYLKDTVLYQNGLNYCVHEELAFGFAIKPLTADEIRACAKAINDGMAAAGRLCQ